jgi:hypothetical protein
MYNDNSFINNYFVLRKILLVILISISANAQNSKGYKMCLTLQGNNISSNGVAENALNRILDVSGLAKNFILYPCNDATDAE